MVCGGPPEGLDEAGLVVEGAQDVLARQAHAVRGPATPHNHSNLLNVSIW